VAGYAISACLLIAWHKGVVITLKKALLLAGAFLLLLFLLAFFFKTDSSLGRLLVYKISIHILQDHWLTGIGWGNFERVYGQYQVAYFKSGHYSTKELLLADNTRFAFNDYLQLAIETGLAGSLALAALLIGIVFLIRRGVKKNPHLLLMMAIVQVIAIAVAAACMHIMEQFAFQALSIVCLGIIVFYNHASTKLIWRYLLTTIVLMGTLAWMHAGAYIRHYDAYKRYGAAKELYRAGYLTDAMKEYQLLYPALQKDVYFSIDYANALINLQQYANAIPVLEKLTAATNSAAVQAKLATCYEHTYQLDAAETAHETAVYMVPNRFTYRYNLFAFYKHTGQQNKAVQTARNISTLPVKIPSLQVVAIQQEVKAWLLEQGE
jgi:tetratricopeptide (TPR) repeat protein